MMLLARDLRPEILTSVMFAGEKEVVERQMLCATLYQDFIVKPDVAMQSRLRY